VSVITAFLRTASASLTAAGLTVPVYFGEAALRDGSGVAVRLPLCVVEDLGSEPQFEMEYEGPEVTKVQVSAYAVTLADIDAIAIALKYANGSPDDQLGLDFGTIAAIVGGVGPYLTFNECRRVSERRERVHVEFTNTAQIVHKVTLTYDVTCNISENA
jgi:hypothetical protein